MMRRASLFDKYFNSVFTGLGLGIGLGLGLGSGPIGPKLMLGPCPICRNTCMNTINSL